MELATKAYHATYLTIDAAYGGRQEIVDAAKAFMREHVSHGKTLEDAVEPLTPATIGRFLSRRTCSVIAASAGS